MSDSANSRDSVVNYKVYIAGQYAPAQQVMAQQGIFSFSEAKITLFPHKELLNFGENDRVPCSIFYFDTHYNKTSPEYRLMFEGEIVNVSYSRTPNFIGMEVSAVSPFEILAQMFKRMFSDIVNEYKSDNSFLQSSTSELGLESLLGNELLSNYSDRILKSTDSYKTLFSSTFMSSKARSSGSTRFMRRPYALLRNILIELINGSSYATNKDNSRKDIVLFFQSFISKKDILKSMFASPVLEDKEVLKSGPTANIILNAISDSESINTIMSSLSTLARYVGSNNTVSYWDIVVRMFSIMMYEVILPLCPPYLRSDVFGVPDMTGTESATDYIKNKKSKAVENSKYYGIMHLLTKPHISFGVPPLCNSIFPCMINSISYTNDHFTKPTRFFLENPGAYNLLSGLNSGDADALAQSFINNQSAYWPPEILKETSEDNSLDNKGNKLIKKQLKIASYLTWSRTNPRINEFFKGQIVLQERRAPDWIDYIRRGVVKKQDNKSKNSTVEAVKSYVDSQQQNVKSVLDLYCRNEFEVETAARNNITIDMKFDPYIVAGFPAAIVDNIQYGTCFSALVTQVIHVLGVSNASTSVTFSNANRWELAYKELVSDAKHTVGPANPSPQVAEIFNTDSGSDNYYKKLLYQGVDTTRSPGEYKYIFSPKDYFVMDSETGGVKTTINTKEQKRLPNVLSGAEGYVENLDDALELVSRPITTMAQYIAFKQEPKYYLDSNGKAKELEPVKGYPHGGVTALRGPRLFNGFPLSKEIKNKALDKNINKDRPILYGVPFYYDQLLGYTYMNQVDSSGVRLFTGRPNSLETYPDFIADWASKIEAYRKDIENIYKDFFIG